MTRDLVRAGIACACRSYLTAFWDQKGSRISRDLAPRAVLVLGAQRSGTTWLGKIFDSHPNVLYRHEPDYLRPAAAEMSREALHATVNSWIRQNNVRSAGKLPSFRKSWHSVSAFAMRHALVMFVNVCARLPVLGACIRRCPISDLVWIEGERDLRPVLKSITWCNGAGVFADALPNSCTILILRHPCGQIASLLRGAEQRRFELRSGYDMPFDELQTTRFAAARGVGEGEFEALPAAAKYAWAWLAFNETAFAALDGRPNTRIVLYEDLCARPQAVIRELFAFVGLAWNSSTEAFLTRSTRSGRNSGYYSVFQDPSTAANRWRSTMTPQDQAAVCAVVGSSKLAQFWPDDFDKPDDGRDADDVVRDCGAKPGK